MSRNGDFEGFDTWNICQEPINFLNRAGIQSTFKSKSVNSFTVHFDTFDPLEIYCIEPFFHLVKRGAGPGDIDQEFQSQALASGVEIRFDFSPDVDKMNIISAGPAKANAYIRGYTFKTDIEDQVHLFLNTTISDTGYAYLIIWNNAATLATAFKKNDSKQHDILGKLKNAAQSVIGHLPVKCREFAAYGSFNINSRKIDEKKRLYIGESGGFQDYLFGFGMNYAIHSGYFAAQSIINNVPFENYYNNRLFPHMKASAINRFFYEKLNEKQRHSMCCKIKSADNPLNFLKNHSRFTLKKKMIYMLLGCKFRR